MARQHRHHARRQRGGDGAPLQPPVLALAEQQAVAGDRPQDADRGAGAAVIAGIVHQHVMDRVGRIDQDAAAASDTADQGSCS